jgi:hypothetical protein
MTAKARPRRAVAPVAKASTAADAGIQITAHRDGYLIKGDIARSNPGLEHFATWDDELGAWYIPSEGHTSMITTTAFDYLGARVLLRSARRSTSANAPNFFGSQWKAMMF